LGVEAAVGFEGVLVDLETLVYGRLSLDFHIRERKALVMICVGKQDVFNVCRSNKDGTLRGAKDENNIEKNRGLDDTNNIQIVT